MSALPRRIVVDGRDLLPPEPLEKTLAAVDELQGDDVVVLQVYCHPTPLFNILRKHGFSWREDVLEDGTHEITIRRA